MKILIFILCVASSTAANAWWETYYEKSQRASKQQALSFKKHQQNNQVTITSTPYPESTNGLCVMNALGTKWTGLGGYLNSKEAGKCDD